MKIGKEVMALVARGNPEGLDRPFGETFIRGVIRGEKPHEEGARRHLLVERLDIEVTLQQPALI